MKQQQQQQQQQKLDQMWTYKRSVSQLEQMQQYCLKARPQHLHLLHPCQACFLCGDSDNFWDSVEVLDQNVYFDSFYLLNRYGYDMF